MTRVVCVVAVLSAFLALSSPSYGQGGTTSTLSGVVVDTSGGVIPGADVVAKHNATGVSNSAVTNAEGLFSFPGLAIGSQTAPVTLQSFKNHPPHTVVPPSGGTAAGPPALG